MTPSPNSSTALCSVPRHPRRAGLLAASALCGVAAMLASPLQAQTLPGIPGAGSITVSAGGSQPVITAPDAVTLEIDLNAPRTVINWSSLQVSSGDTMNFRFDAASDIVLNKTSSQIAINNGATITGTVGASTGGNVWFYSPQGVIVSPGAAMNAGGFVFSGGAGLVDANFVDAADPTAVLRAASNGLIRMSGVSSATSASINAAGDVVLSASSGALAVQTVYGATAQVSTASGSITISEITATQGAATVAAGGPGATVTQITGATGVTVSSANNSSVGSATTTASGDILITSGGSAALTVGNTVRDLSLVAPEVFLSTVDAGRSVYVTGTTQAYVTNRIFAGDDVEITADGSVTAGGVYIRAMGLGTDDSHILIRSTNGQASGGTLLTEGTGGKAGDITVQGAAGVTLVTGVSSRNLTLRGTSASVTNANAAGDLAINATNGSATVVTAATAGDDLTVTAAGGDVLAGGATLKTTGGSPFDTANLVVGSTTGAVNVGSAVTQGLGSITIDGATTATLGSASSSVALYWQANGSLALTGDYSAVNRLDLYSVSGGITQTGGSLTGPLFAKAATGIELVGANKISLLANMDAGSSDAVLNNAEALYVNGAVMGRDVTLTTTDGELTVSPSASIAAAGHLTLTGASGLTATDTGSLVLSGATGITATATTGNVSLDKATTSGSILVRALDGAAALRSASITGSGSIAVEATETATLGADNVMWMNAGHAVTRLAGTGTIDVTSSGADAQVYLHSLDGRLTSVSADADTGSATVLVNETFGVDAVSGFSVMLSSLGAIDATSITVSGGDYSANAPDWAGVTLNPGGTIRNLSITDTAGGLTLANALGATGDLYLESDDVVTSAYALTAGGDVNVRAAGDIDLVSAEAGNDIIVVSTGGKATLRKADLAGGGLGRDLTLLGSDDAVLGDPHYASITSDNLFSRSGGGSGVVTIRSVNGAAMAHLDASAAIDVLDGTHVDVTIVNGAGTLGAITASTGDIYVEVLDGALSLASATGSASLTLVNQGGGLTITGAAHGDGVVDIQTDGLLDVGQVSSGDDLTLVGDSLRANRLEAGGALSAAAIGGDAAVGLAKAAETLEVVALAGDATLRAADAPDGVALIAGGDATFGADDAGSITAANYAITDAVCNCGSGGLQVLSYGGQVAINVDTVSNGFALVGAGGGGVSLVQRTGPLTIDLLGASASSRVEGQGGVWLRAAEVGGDLWLGAPGGGLRLGEAVLGGDVVVDGQLSLNVAADVTQAGVLDVGALAVQAGGGAVLLGDNRLAQLDAVSIASGGFSLNALEGFVVRGPLTAAGQAVTLRSGGAIGQDATGVITAQRLTGASVGGAVFTAANQLAQLGDFTNAGGLLRLNNAGALSIDGVVSSTDAVSLAARGMTLGVAGQVRADGAGDAVILASDGAFANLRGADAVAVSNPAGRWLIYTQVAGDPTAAPSQNSFAGLSAKAFYGAAYDFSAGAFAVAPNSGNRLVYGYRPVLTVTPDSRTVTYDGGIPSISASITGLRTGDAAADAWSGAAALSGAASKNAGIYTLTASLGGLTSDLNYGFAFGTGTLRIDPKTLTGVLRADDKPFDRTASATGAIALTGMAPGDVVFAQGAYAFADANIGLGKTVTATGLVLSGPDAGNYRLAPVAPAQASITAAGPLASNDRDGSPLMRNLGQAPDFTLDWDPELNLETPADACQGDDCRSATAKTDAQAVAALR